MSSEIIEPSFGLSSSDDESADLRGRAASPPKDANRPAPAPSPTAAGTSTSSADELVLALGQISPDPYLDEFKPEAVPDPASGARAGEAEPRAFSIGPWVRDDLDLDVPPSAEITAISETPFGVSAIAAALDLDSTGQPAAPGDSPRADSSSAGSPPSSIAESFAALDLYAPPPSKTAAESARSKKALNEEEGATLDDDEDDALPAHGMNWLGVLHASLTSALAIGLIWVVWGKRVARESAPVETDPFPTAESSADPGHRAGQSRKYVAAAPLPADRIVAPGQTIVIDSLEVTPLEILAGPVILRREINRQEARRGGKNALILKLRLKNRSTDSILVPLDEAFIRTRARGVRDSFIEAGPSRQVDMFPLAIVSEWAIAGQEFRELRPGESYTTAVVSAPDALDHVAPEMTWRLRLRTDINQTGTVGIRFRDRDIRRMSPRETPELPEQPDPGDTPTGASLNQER